MIKLKDLLLEARDRLMRGHTGKMPREWHYVMNPTNGQPSTGLCGDKLPAQNYKYVSGEGKWLDQLDRECITRLKARRKMKEDQYIDPTKADPEAILNPDTSDSFKQTKKWGGGIGPQ